MAADSLFNKSVDEIIKGSNTISITKRTVRFGSDVYQFKNVTGFGLFVRDNRLAAIIAILLFGSLSFFFLSYGNSKEIGVNCAIIMAICLLFLTEELGVTYGLKLYLPSTESKIFISKDAKGIKNIIATLYEFMEKEDNPNAIANITLDQRHARIGIVYAENVNPR